MRGVLGYFITIQSSVKCPQYLSQRIFEFLQNMRIKVDEMTENNFKQHIQSVRVKISQKDLSIFEESECYWKEISNHQFKFERSNLITNNYISIIINRGAQFKRIGYISKRKFC